MTVTRRRPELLTEAVEGVMAQCCEHVAEHLVVIDDCPQTADFLRTVAAGAVRAVPIARSPQEVSGPARLAKLRNVGAQLARADWICYLDDDNAWTPDHLHTLLETAQATGSPAVYSWQQVVHSNRAPYLEQRYPWARSDEEGRAMYRKLLARGVVTVGSNVYRDVADDQRAAGAVRMTDAGEWLLRTDLVRTLGFCEKYSDQELARLIGEDDKLLDSLIDAGVPIACSRRPTLIYRLGGFSNTVEDRIEAACPGDSQ
ncbi:glycosyltransferase family 2 protein [Kribbella sp. CA-293567]|uniref:glycosyltransferase family 2 protein n=1 Tax=Kribbella sp. CA-293567 TaxID=3002436 RepID=UPI0022DD7DCC|nr:glycosyltransferase family A protein [Kribbella sp. CA-293567]WBQ07610.1 glycosyltransferase family A protein [Kribbella sp. CA-293567]